MNVLAITQLVELGLKLAAAVVEKHSQKPINEMTDQEIIAALTNPNLISDTDAAIAQGRSNASLGQ